MEEHDLTRINAELAALMREKLGVRGEGLDSKLRRAGRLLPRQARRAGQHLVEVEKLWENPKLRRRIDPAGTREAAKRLREHLDAIDVADRRKGYWIGVLAPLALNLLLIGAAAVTWLVWSGRV